MLFRKYSKEERKLLNQLKHRKQKDARLAKKRARNNKKKGRN